MTKSPPARRLCHNEGNAMFVLLNPSPCVTLTLSEAKGKGLAFWLGVNSVKNLTRSVILNEVKDLMSSFALLRTCFPACRQAGVNASE